MKEVKDQEVQEQFSKHMTVYRKKSTLPNAQSNEYWYSASRSDGSSVRCVFKCPIETESAAFEISEVIGNAKRKEVVKNGETYVNFTYYITSCKFHEIEGESLPL